MPKKMRVVFFVGTVSNFLLGGVWNVVRTTYYHSCLHSTIHTTVLRNTRPPHLLALQKCLFGAAPIFPSPLRYACNFDPFARFRRPFPHRWIRRGRPRNLSKGISRHVPYHILAHPCTVRKTQRPLLWTFSRRKYIVVCTSTYKLLRAFPCATFSPSYYC